jgi:hypothetical protein
VPGWETEPGRLATPLQERGSRGTLTGMTSLPTLRQPNGPAFYHLRRPDAGSRQVEVWSGYPLQFEGQRRFRWWQDSVAADLRAALAEITMAPGEVLAGTYMSTDTVRCDAENRLFTNPGTSLFPKVTGLRFEWIPGPPPEPPAPVSKVEGNLYYYRYRPGGSWEWWQPATVLASWRHVPVVTLSAGNARSAWLAMKRAGAAGQISTFTSAALDNDAPFGIRITVHATRRGPRRVLAISESLIDGTVAAFHAGASNGADIAALLAPPLESSHVELEKLAAMSVPGPFFRTSPFSGRNASISPSDDRCYVGEVEIRHDPRGMGTEVSGELFTLRTVTV